VYWISDEKMRRAYRGQQIIKGRARDIWRNFGGNIKSGGGLTNAWGKVGLGMRRIANMRFSGAEGTGRPRPSSGKAKSSSGGIPSSIKGSIFDGSGNKYDYMPPRGVATNLGQSAFGKGAKNAMLQDYGLGPEGLFRGIKEQVASKSMKGIGGLAMKALPMAFTGYLAYEGYKENGVMGAVGGLAEAAVWSAGMGGVMGAMGAGKSVISSSVTPATKASAAVASNAGEKVTQQGLHRLMGTTAPTVRARAAGLAGRGGAQAAAYGKRASLARQIVAGGTRLSMGGAMLIGGLVGAAPIYASYKALSVGRDRMKSARRLEMGTPITDPFGNQSTMRQRSMHAIQRSGLSARQALGREASLMGG